MSDVQKEFTTKGGTVLPLLTIEQKKKTQNSRGGYDYVTVKNPYLQVAHRIVWFREEHPDWSIQTEIVEHDDTHAICRASIIDPSGRLLATAIKHENISGFGDYLEKSETGSIGRALALFGYGTQFTGDELDEGERLADAPVQPTENGASGPTEKTENVDSGERTALVKEICAAASAKGLKKNKDMMQYLGEVVKHPLPTKLDSLSLDQLKEIVAAIRATNEGWVTETPAETLV